MFVPRVPPGANLEALVRQTALYTADGMPAAIDLLSAVSRGVVAPKAVTQLEQVRRWVCWTLALVQLWREVCLLLLAGYLLLSARTWAGLAEGFAFPLAASGVVTLLIALVVFGLAAAAAGLSLPPAASGWPPEVAGLLAEAVGYAGRAAALRVAAWGGGFLGLGALGWATGRVLRSRATRPAQPGRSRSRLV